METWSVKKGDKSSFGMPKIYRIDRFKEIGGFIRAVMWDGIDCHRYSMPGWIACSWDEPELCFVYMKMPSLEPF
jgi:hypothetical protein